MEPTLFDRVVEAANVFIKAGATIDPSLLNGTSSIALKKFYDATRKVPWLEPLLSKTRLKERAWRCASHVAFYALQEHQRRCTIIPAITSAMQGMSLIHFRESSFPGLELLTGAREALQGAGVPPGCQATVYLENMARHARNLLRSELGTRYKGEVKRGITSLAGNIQGLVERVTKELEGHVDSIPGEIARIVSTRLTRRVKDRSRGRGAPVGKHRLDALVDSILDGKDLASWQPARRQWRDNLVEDLSSKTHDLVLDTIARDSIAGVFATLTVEEALGFIFKPRSIPSVRFSGPGLPDISNVLLERGKAIAKNYSGSALLTILAPTITNILGVVHDNPMSFLKLPKCKKQSIPVAIDDGQVYRLDIQLDDATGKVTSATVHFSLEPYQVECFFLRDLDRIDAMLSRGFKPARGTITRKTGGGLLLHLPFEKEFIPVDGSPASTTKREGLVDCGVDLGLKHFAWLSIGDHVPSTPEAGSRDDVISASREIARYCIDQPQLVGSKDAWLVGGSFDPIPNLKRKLIALAGRVRRLQQRKDLLKQRYPGRYKHSMQYFTARREWQRCWQKMRHLHEEITRQVATRIIAACKHYGVKLLRFEDLSWSSHSSKRVSGAWLASWQVHWFFSQVQERAILLARLAGIAVELVDARNTSKRCSTCGTIGNRKGKTFTCVNEDCNKKLDSDLNGARNVRTARTSPRLYARGGGARYRPLACPA